MSQDSILPPLSPEPRISEDIDDSHEQWSDAHETLDTDTVDRGIQEMDPSQDEDITLKHASLATSDDTKAADAPAIDTTLDGPSPTTRSPSERAFDSHSVQSLPTVHITEPQSPSPRPQTATMPSFNANSTDHISPSPTRSVWSSADTSPSARRHRPRSNIVDNRASNRLSGFFSNLIHRRDNAPPPSPREPTSEDRQPRTPDGSLPQSRASSPAPPARPTTPPPQLPPPTLQELGLSLSVFTNILSPSHFSTPPTSGAFLAPHFLLLCHAQGLDVLPLVSPPAPAPYALIRRVSFKSVVVMEHRGVLVAIAGRRDGVRVYALEEVKKAVEWRLDVEIRRQRDRARREEAKRSTISRDSATVEKSAAEKKSMPSGASAPSGKSARRSSLASSTTIVSSKATSSKKAKSPARPPQLPPPPTPPQLPSVPPPSYTNSPPSRPLRPQTSFVSVHPSRSRSGSVTNVLGGAMPRRTTETALLGRELVRDADAKSDWMDGHASEEEAIDVVAAGERGSEALDERTSAMAAASASPVIGRPEAPPLTNRPLSSSTLTQQSVRRPRPANLDLSIGLSRTGSQASPPPPSPTPTLVTLRQALAASPSSSYLPTMGSMSSRINPMEEPPTPDGEEDEEDDGDGNRTPRSEEISFAEALRESRLPELPPPGSRRNQQAILITASHPVASGEDDVPSSPMSADAGSWRTRQSQETNRRRRRWSVLGGVFSPPPDQQDPGPSMSSNHSHPQSISSLPSASEMRPRRNGPLSRSQSTAFRQSPISQTTTAPRPSSAHAPSPPSALAQSVHSEVEGQAPKAPSRFLSRILGHAFTPRRSEDSGPSLPQRTDQVDPGWRLAGTPNGTQPAPAPKLEYVKLPGTKGSLMIKAVETSKKSFLAILCGDNGEKVELFAGTYRTALGLSRTFILPDSPRSLELQLQGDDLVEVFLMFSQNVFGLEPATVRVREVRIGRAERRAARRRARELRGDDATTVGAEPDATASEEQTNVNVSIGVSVSSSTTVSAAEGPAEPSIVSGITASSSQAPSDQLASTETPQSTAVQPTDELVALATAQMGPYTTFQQLSFAPNFPLAAIADDYIIPPTYPDFLQYRAEYEPEVNGSSQVDLSQVQFSPPGLPQPLPAPPARWFYRDPKGVVHGPWKASLMQAWYRDGLLPPDLPVRREEDTDYIQLKDLRQQSVDPTQPFGLTAPKAYTTEAVPAVSDGKPLLAPISLLSQPKIFGPPALFFSSRGGHSTVIVDGRGRSVLKGRLMWSADDQDDEAAPARLGDVKRLEAFDVQDKSVLVAMRQGGLEAVDLSDALLRPADASRTTLPQFTAPLSQINRRAPFIWRIGMPVSSPSSAPTALALSKPSTARALVHKKHVSHPSKTHGRTDLGGGDIEVEHSRDEVIFLGRQDDNIYLCERNAGAFRILRLCPSTSV